MSDNLQEDWKAFVIKSLSVFREEIARGSKVPTLERQVITFGEPGLDTIELLTVPNYVDLIPTNREALVATKEYQTLASTMMGDPIISRHVGQPVLTFQGGGTRDVWDYAIFPLGIQLGSKTPLDFDDQLFSRVFSDLEQSFSANTLQFWCVVPLQNFRAPSDNIDLGDGLTIRAITNEERIEVLRMLGVTGGGPYFKVLQFTSVIEMLVDSPKVIGAPVTPPMIDLYSKVDRIVTALRIFKEGNVAYNMIHVRPVLMTPLATRSATAKDRSVEWGKHYRLADADIAEFKSFWNEFNSFDLEHRTTMSVALRRFGFGYERNQPEDKLIDMMIAYEALFLGHKLAIRFARLLGDSFETRLALEKEMRDFYCRRSAIVHGGRAMVDDQYNQKVEARLRSSLKLLLPMFAAQGQKEALAHLDLD